MIVLAIMSFLPVLVIFSALQSNPIPLRLVILLFYGGLFSQVITAAVFVIWWLKLRKHKLIVGETEKHQVEIMLKYKLYIGWRKKEFIVRIDGESYPDYKVLSFR